MRVQPLITVGNVEASSRWYRELLGCESGHGGPEYEMLLTDGQLLLQLHHWNDHEHPNMGDREPRVNPLAKHRECWMRDPDGYTIVLASPPGDVG